MARKRRILFPNAFYHVTSRGNGRGTIFFEDKDRFRLLDVLETTVERFNWLCHGYGLMGNHFHLLLETPDGNLPRGMQYLESVFSQASNRRHQRPGHVLQGRYGAILVEKEPYFLELSRYIVLNPRRAGLVEKPEDWPWSSYRPTIGQAPVPPFLTTDFLLKHFHQDKGSAMAAYRDFVMAGIGMKNPLAETRGGQFLGSDEFLREIRSRLMGSPDWQEVNHAQRIPVRPALEDLLCPEIRSEMALRNELAAKAFFQHGYLLREIAGHLGMNPAYLSRVIHRVKRGR